MGPEVAVVFRRLIASMALLACLLGIVQPAIACANCTSRTDCCPFGSPAGCSEQMHLASHCAQASNCCALSAAIAPSASPIGSRTSHGDSTGSFATALPAVVRVGQQLAELRALQALTPDPINESLTYLRTARLRL
jgi:hypothetical protein